MSSTPNKSTMASSSLFGSSGIRQIVNKELLRIALDIGMAVGRDYREIVVGSDTRTSSDAVKSCLIAGMLVAGARVYDAGVLPTPTLAYIARDFGAAAMVTASHNPPQYNGIKLLNKDGSAFDPAQRSRVEKQIGSADESFAPWQDFSRVIRFDGAISRHVERIAADFPEKRRLKVVVDAGCGAAYATTPVLLERMGYQVIAMNCYPCGIFPREIEPNESSLKELAKTVVELGADLGIAHDGDADRMMAVDDRGRFIPGDVLLAVFAFELGAREVVTTVDASMIIDGLGMRIIRTKVGDIYVSEQLKQGGDWGGESSGSWVFPGVSLCPDGIYAAALLADIASRVKLSEIVDRIPTYPILRGSVARNGVSMSVIEQRLRQLKPLAVSTIDGCRLEFSDGWLLVRASGTEPKIRITAEAQTSGRVQELFNGAVGLLQQAYK